MAHIHVVCMFAANWNSHDLIIDILQNQDMCVYTYNNIYATIPGLNEYTCLLVFYAYVVFN